MAALGKTAVGFAIVLILVLVFPSVSPTTRANPDNRIAFTPNDLFNLPDFDGNISFVRNGSYANATYSGGVWTFIGLKFNESSYNSANFSVSAKNCNITIFSAPTAGFSGRSLSMRYNVTGGGSQSICFLDIHRKTSNIEWNVIVPSASGGSVWLSEGQNWNLLPNNTVVIYGIEGNVSLSLFNLGMLTGQSNLPFFWQHSIAIFTGVVLLAVVAAALVVKFAARRRP